jgi:signal transduction histidine kinase
MIIEFADINVAGAGIGVVAVPRDAPPFFARAPRSRSDARARRGLALDCRHGHRGAGDLPADAAAPAGVTGRRARDRRRRHRACVPRSGGRDEVSSVARAFNDMAAQLEERTSALEQADRTRRQLLADVSHELMTPLSAIRGYVETLRMSEPARGTTRRAAATCAS